MDGTSRSPFPSPSASPASLHYDVGDLSMAKSIETLTENACFLYKEPMVWDCSNSSRSSGLNFLFQIGPVSDLVCCPIRLSSLDAQVASLESQFSCRVRVERGAMDGHKMKTMGDPSHPPLFHLNSRRGPVSKPHTKLALHQSMSSREPLPRLSAFRP